MTRIVHLSDLHFGRDRQDLVAPLVSAVNRLAPDLVAISGDLTQRARPEQFAAARTFIDALHPEVLCVPGNHDVPLYNVFLRWLMPWLRYRQWIGHELEPQYSDDTSLVIGLNTADPYSLQRGLVTSRSADRVCELFAREPQRLCRIIVAHHPLEHDPGERKKLMRGAGRALDNLSDCGMEVVLSGHLHAWRAESFAERPGGGNTAIQVHAGTGLSTRLRGETNDFNLVEISADKIVVQRYEVRPDALHFSPSETRSFDRDVSQVRARPQAMLR